MRVWLNLTAFGLVAGCACVMIAQLGATVHAIGLNDIKFYHDPVQAFFALEMMYFLSAITIIASVGLLRNGEEMRTVNIVGLILLYVILLLQSVSILSKAVNAEASTIEFLGRVPWYFLLPIPMLC